MEGDDTSEPIRYNNSVVFQLMCAMLSVYVHVHLISIWDSMTHQLKVSSLSHSPRRFHNLLKP